MERAKTVRDFPVSSGMNSDQVRAVSYGKDASRQVTKGATHAAGKTTVAFR